MTEKPKGMRKGLTRYGDEGFSLYLRKSFIKAMGYTDDALERPIVGITNTYSGYNACHGNVPDLDGSHQTRRDAGRRPAHRFPHHLGARVLFLSRPRCSCATS